MATLAEIIAANNSQVTSKVLKNSIPPVILGGRLNAISEFAKDVAGVERDVAISEAGNNTDSKIAFAATSIITTANGYTDAQVAAISAGILPAQLTTNPASNPAINAYFLIGGAGSYTNILTAASTPMTLSAPEAAEGLWMAYKGSDGFWDKTIALQLPENVVTTDNIVESIVNAGMGYSGVNQVTNFPISGYIDEFGVHHAYPSYKLSEPVPVPEGLTRVKSSFSSTYGISMYSGSIEALVFIETLGGSGPGDFDIEFELPLGTTFMVQQMPTDYLPGGADYGTKPQYLYFYELIKHQIPWLDVSVGSIHGAKKATPSGNRAEYFPNYGYINSVGTVVPLTGFYHTDFIPIPLGINKFKVGVAGDFSGALYDSTRAFVSTFGVAGQVYDKEFDVPAGVHFIKYTANVAFMHGGSDFDETPAYLIFEPFYDYYSINGLNAMLSDWVGKNIAWYGTSIPAGYPKESNRNVWSYANKCVNQLGGIIQNYCVSNGLVRAAKYNGSPVAGGRESLRFSVNTSTINYQNSMVNLIGTANEPDLFVFNYDVNDIDDDATDFNLFDPLDPYNAAMPINSRNKNYFIGAMNFCIDALRAVKPKARICFITHFSEDSNATEQEYKKCIDIGLALGRYWGAPVLNLAAQTQWIHKGSFNSIGIYNPDGIHPASAPTTESVDLLADILAKFLKNIR